MEKVLKIASIEIFSTQNTLDKKPPNSQLCFTHLMVRGLAFSLTNFPKCLKSVIFPKFWVNTLAVNVIDMSRCDGLECFCSSIGINVYGFSSVSICCIESDIGVFIFKPFTKSSRIASYWDSEFYQIIFHCIQILLCMAILYSCPKCRYICKCM